MIFHCKPCGRFWSRWPTSKRVLRAPFGDCPDCAEPRQARSRRRGKK